MSYVILQMLFLNQLHHYLMVSLVRQSRMRMDLILYVLFVRTSQVGNTMGNILVKVRVLLVKIKSKA